ncbi:hypothetical protein NliqN6_5400 [Naganishia liquefaciens]|uniref:Uncharacterized protein n=1 Tax=Naganishia liquefaciens TaxID=104408 RepID=A0A8H3TY64_9TREE|nr:hypothetical protein NliqN6_5400 [Naganishia liquefaciens]
MMLPDTKPGGTHSAANSPSVLASVGAGGQAYGHLPHASHVNASATNPNFSGHILCPQPNSAFANSAASAYPGYNEPSDIFSADNNPPYQFDSHESMYASNASYGSVQQGYPANSVKPSANYSYYPSGYGSQSWAPPAPPHQTDQSYYSSPTAFTDAYSHNANVPSAWEAAAGQPPAGDGRPWGAPSGSGNGY